MYVLAFPQKLFKCLLPKPKTLCTLLLMHPQAFCQTQDESKRVKQRNCLELGARSQLLALEGVEGRDEAPGLNQEEGQAIHSLDPASNQPTSWLVHILEHPWCQDKPRSTLDSPRPELGGSHHLPPYSTRYSSPQRLHLNGTFSQDSKGGVPKLFRFGLLRLWASITSCLDLGLG